MSPARALAVVARHLFFMAVVRPLVLVVLGINLRHREHLPRQGPAVIVANHNSHLDTLVLMTLFPQRLLERVRPVAAADYFLRNRALAWFARDLIGIIPLPRKPEPGHDPLEPLDAALARGDILIFFPEGSRGAPEQLTRFKTGIAHLMKRHPTVPVVPVFLHGLGKALPRGEFVLVPFFADMFVGAPFAWTGERTSFMAELDTRLHALAAEGRFAPWE